ncbi:MAG: DNA mismatch repair endonuclease MutL [Chloroflexi bacterium]|nr:DNA mismatch repair endonuclease MutL [Chloroflexota bacterium]
MAIRILPPDVARRIAAGEVIERPASVVKELIENALDAGARQITIEARAGGLGLLRVADDGSGIPSAEVELAFERHATSKLACVDDLATITTLGFRGEALASIAAVSRVTLYTRWRGEELGTQLELEAGQVMLRKPWAGAPGTTILVRDLFFNVPARLKFLRSPTGEAGLIGHVVEQIALARPDIRFRFLNEGRPTLETPGSGTLRDVLRRIHGSAVADALVDLDEVAETCQLRVHGLVGPPTITRANRSGMAFFINRRWISRTPLGAVVEEAYRPALPPGRHPVAVLHLELPPAEVDCNVHPAKAEVRLRNERLVHAAVHRAVRTALLQVAPLPEVGAPLVPTGWGKGRAVTLFPPVDHIQSGEADRVFPRKPVVETEDPSAAVATSAGAPAAGADRPVFRPTALRPVGQVQNTYIVAEGADGVYFIDQHTAHERILYEELLAGRSRPDPPSQALLAPVVVTLSAHQRAVLTEQGEELRRLGFAFEEFGPDAVALRAVPPRLAGADLARAFRDAVDALSGDPVGPDGTDRLLATLACHAAVRAGDPLTAEEIASLLARLEETDVSRYCPHGRPIVVHLPVAQLERDFHRR